MTSIIFSAAKAVTNHKRFYKNFERRSVKSMTELGEIAVTHSISSYLYGEGVTEGGEECVGHRSGESVIGAGNVMLFDVDAADGREISLEEVIARLTEANAMAWVGGSKGWSEDRPKMHIAVVLDDELPMDKEEYRDWHRAVAQLLGLDKYEDPAMESWTQQLAPSRRDGIPFIALDGQPIDTALAFARYDATAVEKTRGAGGGIDGTLDEDVVFTLSTGPERGAKVGVREMLERVRGGRKVRVECLAGIEHGGGRRDNALVRGGPVDGTLYYHCTGGRCGHTLTFTDHGFVADEGVDDVEVAMAAEAERLGNDDAESVSVWDMLEDMKYMIAENGVHSLAYGERAKDKQREAAVAYAAQRVMSNIDARRVEDRIMRFDGVIWRPVFEDSSEATRWVQAAFVECGFAGLASSLSALNSVLGLLDATVPWGVLKNRGHLLNLGNGMLDLDTGALLPGDRDALFTTALPFDYDPSAECPEWERMVERIMLGNNALIEALRDGLGYLFARGLFLEIMIGFVGEGANGKSTVIEVVRRLVGAEGSSSQSLNVLTKPTGEGSYARAALAGKMVNFTSELSGAALMSNEFKELISGAHIMARNPYGKQFEIPVAPKQLCAMNSTRGLIREKTHGFMRRLWLLPFGYRVPESERDPELISKLDKELAGILNWVLVGTRRVIKARGLMKAPQMEALMADVVRDSDPVQQFLEERTAQHEMRVDDVQPRHKLGAMVVHVSDLYAKYKEFCDDNSYRPLGRNDFSQDCERLGVTKVNLATKNDGKVTKVSGFFLRTLGSREWAEPKSGRALYVVK